MRSLASATILTRSNKQLNKGSIFGVLASGLLLAGCGGGSGGSSDNDPKTSTDAIEPSTNNLLEAIDPGIFNADVTRPSGSQTSPAIALLSPSGRVVLLYNRTAITSAEINFDQDGSFSGPGKDIFYSGDEWVQNDGKLEGEAISKSVIEGEAKTTSGELRSSFIMERDGAVSAQGASLETVSDSYLEQKNGISTNLTIETDGDLTGSDDTGCIFNGSVSVPDERFNVYEVSFDASRCGDVSNAAADLRNGTYTGLALYDQDAGRLDVIIENGNITEVFSDPPR